RREACGVRAERCVARVRARMVRWPPYLAARSRAPAASAQESSPPPGASFARFVSRAQSSGAGDYAVRFRQEPDRVLGGRERSQRTRGGADLVLGEATARRLR